MARLIWPLLVAFGLAAIFSAAAFAQDKSLETAKQHFDEGQSLFAAGQYGQAAEEFQKAYDAKPFAAFLYNIAVCYERNQDYSKALDSYERYLEKDPRSPDRNLVLKRITNLRQHLSTGPTSRASSTETSALPPGKTRGGIVVIDSKPEGAAIYIDSKRNGVFTRTPFYGTLPQGQHTAIIELRKFKPERKTFFVRDDGFVYLYFGLSAEEYLGWIEVRANVPGADVFFDEKRVGAVGRTPYTGFLRPGRRMLYLEKPGYQPTSRALDITAGKDHLVDVSLEKVTFGWLRVTGQTTAGASILLDGKPLRCQSQGCQTELAPGQYSVQVQRKGWKSYRERVSVRQATETQLRVRLEPKPPRTKAYITFGVSGALLLSGLICGVLSANEAGDLEKSWDGRPIDSGDPRFLTGRVLAATADSLFVLGALAGGLGLYYMFRNEGPDSYGEAREQQIALDPTPPMTTTSRAPRRTARPAITLVPSVAPRGAGLTGMVKF